MCVCVCGRGGGGGGGGLQPYRLCQTECSYNHHSTGMMESQSK